MKPSILSYPLSFLIFFGITLISCSSPLGKTTQVTQEISQVSSLKLPEIDPKYRNEWIEELEKNFQKRSLEVIDKFADLESYGNGYGENEKRSYPRAMFDFLAGNEDKAIAFLQQVDYFVANTGKNLVRRGKKRGDQIGQDRKLLILYNSQTKDKSPIFLDYKEGKLQVKAGGHEF